MIDRRIHLPMAQLRILLHAILGTLQRERAYAGGLTELAQLVFAKRHAPGFDVLVELLLELQPSPQCGEPRCDGPGWCTHHLDQPLPLRVGLADDHTPIIVVAGMGAIGIVWRDRQTTVVVNEWRAGPVRTVARWIAGATRASPVHGVVEQRGTIERDPGHHLGLIDVLAFARHVAVVKADERAHRPVHAARIVHVGPAPASRWLVG